MGNILKTCSILVNFLLYIFALRSMVRNHFQGQTRYHIAKGNTWIDGHIIRVQRFKPQISFKSIRCPIKIFVFWLNISGQQAYSRFVKKVCEDVIKCIIDENITLQKVKSTNSSFLKRTVDIQILGFCFPNRRNKYFN